jgi:hypothetical protein
MTQQQFIEEIKQLSIEDRIALIEAISRSLREDLEARESQASKSGSGLSGVENSPTDKRQGSITERLRGILKTDAAPPSSEELRDAYTKYLMEKYS